MQNRVGSRTRQAAEQGRQQNMVFPFCVYLAFLTPTFPLSFVFSPFSFTFPFFPFSAKQSL
jgi:hypothetical protein